MCSFNLLFLIVKVTNDHSHIVILFERSIVWCHDIRHISSCALNLLTPCLLKRRNYSEIELLFQLLRAFTGRFLCNMTFLKEYMEEEIPRNYSIAQKRALFFRFVEFNDPHFNDELKAKVRIPAIRSGKSIYDCMSQALEIPQ